jgi:hypothetical protein
VAVENYVLECAGLKLAKKTDGDGVGGGLIRTPHALKICGEVDVLCARLDGFINLLIQFGSKFFHFLIDIN